MDFHAVAGCFDDYVDVCLQMREEFSTGARVVRSLVPDPSGVVARVKQNAALQAINKIKLQEIILKQTKNVKPISEYLAKFNQYISLDYVVAVFSDKNSEMPPLPLISR